MPASNPWIKFLQEYRKKAGKGESLKSSMKKAAVLYRAQKGGKAPAKKKKAKKGKK